MVRKQDNFNLAFKSGFPPGQGYSSAFLLLFIILAVIYSNSFQASWHLDDYANIVDNANVQLESLAWSNIVRTFQGMEPEPGSVRRPLAYLTFAINYFFHGTDVVGYHIVNFLIHYLNAVFLYLIFRNTLRLPRLQLLYADAGGAIALLAVVLWSTHPIQVSAVTYIVQRMTSLATLFYLMGIYFYAKMRIESVKGWSIGYCLLIGLVFIGAIACKENAVMLPISLMLYELILIQSWQGQKQWGKRLVWLLVPLVLVLAASWQLTSLDQILSGYHDRPFTWQQRLLTEPRVIWFYVSLILYPASFRLTLLHDFDISTSLINPWTTLPALAGIMAVVVLSLVSIRRRPLLAFALFFFLLNHLIESSFIPLEIVFEHRNYLPSAFIFLMIAIGVVYLLDYFAYHRGLQLLLVFSIVLVIAAQGHTVYYRNSHWVDELSLWQDNVTKAPNLHRPHHNLGKALLVAGRMPEAQAAMQAALTAKPGARVGQKYTTHHNLGVYYMFHQQYAEALKHFNKTLEHIPDHPPTYHVMAKIMLYQDRLPDAHAYINQAMRRCLDCWEFYLTYSLILLKAGDADGALQAIDKAKETGAPDDRIVYFQGEAFRYKGELQRALYYFERYHANSPDSVTGIIALVELYYLLDRQDALERSVMTLVRLIDEDYLSDVLVKFHKEANMLDYSRIHTVVTAITQILQRQIENLEQLLH